MLTNIAQHFESLHVPWCQCLHIGRKSLPSILGRHIYLFSGVGSCRWLNTFRNIQLSGRFVRRFFLKPGSVEVHTIVKSIVCTIILFLTLKNNKIPSTHSMIMMIRNKSLKNSTTIIAKSLYYIPPVESAGLNLELIFTGKKMISSVKKVPT